MSKKIFIGIDNGVSGTVGVVGDKSVFCNIPTKVELNYTKKKSNITRIDFGKLKELLSNIIDGYNSEEIIVALERPMVNPTRFTATTSALRAWEATVICLEELKLPHIIVDSKDWQKVLLPKGVSGDALKKASKNIGDRLFPQFKDFKHTDRDGILIAEYLRKNF